MLLIKRILLSFPEFLSVVAEILHGVPAWTFPYFIHHPPAWTHTISVLYSPTSKNGRKKYFVRVEVNQTIIFGKAKLHFDAKNIFFSKHFWRLVNKIRIVFYVLTGTLRTITATTDNNSGNESKIRLPSKTSPLYAHFLPL